MALFYLSTPDTSFEQLDTFVFFLDTSKYSSLLAHHTGLKIHFQIERPYRAAWTERRGSSFIGKKIKTYIAAEFRHSLGKVPEKRERQEKKGEKAIALS